MYPREGKNSSHLLPLQTWVGRRKDTSETLNRVWTKPKEQYRRNLTWRFVFTNTWQTSPQNTFYLYGAGNVKTLLHAGNVQLDHPQVFAFDNDASKRPHKSDRQFMKLVRKLMVILVVNISVCQWYSVSLCQCRLSQHLTALRYIMVLIWSRNICKQLHNMLLVSLFLEYAACSIFLASGTITRNTFWTCVNLSVTAV